MSVAYQWRGRRAMTPPSVIASSSASATRSPCRPLSAAAAPDRPQTDDARRRRVPRPPSAASASARPPSTTRPHPGTAGHLPATRRPPSPPPLPPRSSPVLQRTSSPAAAERSHCQRLLFTMSLSLPKVNFLQLVTSPEKNLSVQL